MITFTRDWRGYAKGSSVGTLEATIEALAVAEGAATYGGIAGPLNSYLGRTNAVQAQVDPAGKIALRFLFPSGDTTGVTDRLAWQDAHDSLPAWGGEIWLREGAFYLDAAVTYSKSVKTVGAGGGLTGNASTSPQAATTVYCLSATANAINCNAQGASGCTWSDFALVNIAGSTPTAGAGINTTSMTNSIIDRMTILGFWNNLDLGGVYYQVTNNHIYDAVNYSIYAHSPTWPVSPSYLDHGDFLIANNVISGWNRNYASAANFRWESGGGIKIIGNKFNSGGQPGNVSAGVAAYCIDMLVADGCTTSSVVITGNSISGWATNTANIRIGQLGTTGKLINMVIVGNEITIGTRNVVFGGNASGADYISNLEFSGNIMAYSTTGGIEVRNCREVHIGPNSWRQCASPLINIAPSPDTGTGVLGIKVDPQSLGLLDAIDVIQDNRTFGNTINQTAQGVVYDYTRGIYIAAQSTWQTACVLTMPNGSAGVIELDVDGQNGNAGHNSGNNKGVVIRQTRSYDVNTSGVVTLATIGTDVSGGAGAAYVATQFVTGTNTVTIQVQTTDPTQLSLWAGARVRVNGKLTKFHIGA